MKAKALAEETVVLTLPVAHVTDDGQRHVLEMSADLVSTTGLGICLDERVALERAQHAHSGDGRKQRAALLRPQGMVDSVAFEAHAAANSQVALPHLTGFEESLHVAGDF